MLGGIRDNKEMSFTILGTTARMIEDEEYDVSTEYIRIDRGRYTINDDRRGVTRRG